MSFVVLFWFMSVLSATKVIAFVVGTISLVCCVFCLTLFDTMDWKDISPKFWKSIKVLCFIAVPLFILIPNENTRNVLLVAYGSKVLAETEVAQQIGSDVLKLYHKSVRKLEESLDVTEESEEAK